MDSTPLKVAVQILRHHQIPACVVGELALNYYNVPRVQHDAEICIADTQVTKAVEILCSTGLFETADLSEFNLYDEYKRGRPRLQTTGWTSPSQSIVIFPDETYGLKPLHESLVNFSQSGSEEDTIYWSKEIPEASSSTDVASLPFPRLPAFLRGLLSRYLETEDDVAMIAAEQLVDGMNIDKTWCEKNFQDTQDQVLALLERLIAGKKSRLDPFNEYQITCFVKDEEEAANLRRIPGYGLY